MTDLTKIPVTVITGFLGAGKTTLIRHLMQNPQGKRLAVLVNEFGTVGVDGDILKSCADENCPAENIVELANGCICCTVADDFIPTIEALMAMPQRPDHILIETSGLALPKPLLKAFDWPAIRSRITVDGVIALADAEAVAAGRFAPDEAAVQAQREADDSLAHATPLSEVFEDQIACADIVLLSKADLAGEAGLAAAKAVIEAETPRKLPILPMTEGVIDPRVVLGLNARAEDDLDARPSHHDGHDDHEHEEHGHDDHGHDEHAHEEHGHDDHGHEEHAGGRHPGSLGHAGHHLFEVAGPLSRSGRGPDHLFDRHGAAFRSQRHGRPWLLRLRLFLCLRPVQGWHGYVLGAEPRPRIYEPTRRTASGRRDAAVGTGCHIGRLGV